VHQPRIKGVKVVGVGVGAGGSEVGDGCKAGLVPAVEKRGEGRGRRRRGEKKESV
jgi:hypothetical protein